MTASLRALGPVLRLVGAYPLHLAAALLAAVIAELLLTVQPLFLRVFIDQAQAQAPKARLWLFPAFMAAAAALSYAFDYLSVALRYGLRQRVEQRLKEVCIDDCPAQRPETARFALKAGITRLSQLAQSLSADFVLVLARIALILLFLSLDQPALGLATFVLTAAGVVLTLLATLRIGRLSRASERTAGRMVALALAAAPAAARARLARILGYERLQFQLRSVNVFLAFVVFRLGPIAALAGYLLGAGLSVGALASTFLYFTMLRGPYGELTQLLQESIVSFSESALFRAELERSLESHAWLARLPAGLLWERSPRRRGLPLSRVEAEESRAAREFHDDLPESAERSRALAALSRRAVERSILLHSEGGGMERHAHFLIDGAEARLAHAF